eukprot:CAMPEP_0113493490 /NCGR_PEP_ID=MMETSP0014_2-20120614/28618_1 /TAXON_ID=2857 /ORGANISM="Nitzschia sp." /LENGTH=531 /DNA_ID=CAMNT_0000387353 /DNA_START=392 /DNA_END=1983 /DNA_ORIENTATION=+ /assembly_acc=CAM_ASM_000159
MGNEQSGPSDGDSTMASTKGHHTISEIDESTNADWQPLSPEQKYGGRKIKKLHAGNGSIASRSTLSTPPRMQRKTMNLNGVAVDTPDTVPLSVIASPDGSDDSSEGNLPSNRIPKRPADNRREDIASIARATAQRRLRKADAAAVASAAAIRNGRSTLNSYDRQGHDASKDLFGGAQEGSLAEALGMSVDRSKAAPGIRLGDDRDASSSQQKRKSMKYSSNAQHRAVEGTASANQNSLAAALGMSVDTSRNAPAIREASNGRPMSKHSSSGGGKSRPSTGNTKANTNSLAAALGMSVDNSRGAPAIRQAQTKTPQTPNKSLMDAVMSSANNKINDDSPEHTNEYFVQPRRATTTSRGLPKRSFADMVMQRAAMEEDVVSEFTEPDQERYYQSSRKRSTKKKSLADIVMARTNVSTGYNDSVTESTDDTSGSPPGVFPQANSLAMALGMKVDPTSHAPAIREKGHSAVIGAIAPDGKPGGKQSAGGKKSLAGLVMTRAAMDDESEESESEYSDASSKPGFNPQANSLAMALG